MLNTTLKDESKVRRYTVFDIKIVLIKREQYGESMGTQIDVTEWSIQIYSHTYKVN